MKKLGQIIWWLLFIFFAIVMQTWIIGLDALVVGLILLLQERDYKNLLWILPLFILIQEGMGTRIFGAAIILYIATFLLFHIGRWLFEVENFVFIFLLSSCIGVSYFTIYWLMAPLQDIPFLTADMLDLCLIQALYIPLSWKIFVTLRTWVNHAEER